MLKKLKEAVKNRKRQKELEHLRELMSPPKVRRPAKKCVKK